MWVAHRNSGISADGLSKEIANYRSNGVFEEDCAAFRSIFEVQKHPKMMLMDVSPGNFRCTVRNYVLDIGTLKCLSCVLPLHKTMTELFLYNAGMSNQAVDLLSTTLPRCTSLVKVHLDYNPLEDPSVFAQILAVNMPARSVSLRGNDLREAGAVAVARALAENTWIQTLNLFGNQIGDRGGAEIVNKLRFNTMLKSLSLSRNACANETLIGLVDTLTGSEVSVDAKAEYHRYASRLTELNKCIASGKKMKTKYGEDIPPNIEEIPLFGSIVTVDHADFVTGNRVLEMINLSSNEVTEDGASLAVKKLSRQPAGGLEFELSKSTWEINITNNPIEHERGVKLSRVCRDRIVF
mmetsp:Transcript_13049/g.40201  ORF Transcript_13049/g.40201 Transcript_13049/m.40201 type:complete len:352 (+) Transcript_13049:121-1176(+)